MKHLLAIPLILLSLVAILFIYFASFSLDIDQLNKCFVAKMNQVTLCPNEKSFVRLNAISEHLKNAIMLSEDATFFHHRGFDWFELKASFKTNLKSGGFARGGSTITQQLAKNLFLNSEKSILRKVHEAFYTVHLERSFKKNQLFELYLNVIELGPELYGVGKASQFYFNKSASEINILEAAFLAFLLPSPKAYSQSYRKQHLTKFARQRVIDIVYRMYRFKRISEQQYRAAKDLVDLFPWKELGPESRHLLGEPGLSFDSPLTELEGPDETSTTDIKEDSEDEAAPEPTPTIAPMSPTEPATDDQESEDIQEDEGEYDDNGEISERPVDDKSLKTDQITEKEILDDPISESSVESELESELPE